MTQAGYDAGFCSMEWPEGDWLWTQSASYCSTASSSSSLECNWNLNQDHMNTRTPIPIPAIYSQSNTYLCDNEMHDLKWVESGVLANRYRCACGQSLSSNVNCTGRCDVPWTAAFNKRCNVITQSVTKGNFSSYGGNQGTCLRGAGQRDVVLNGANPVDAPQANLKSSDIIVIDGFGLTQVCSTDNQDRGNGRICNCDGELPEIAWGTKVAFRDACGLTKSADKAWIAGPIIGGIALLAFISILAAMFARKRRRKQVELQDHEDIPMDNLDHLRVEEISPVSSIPSVGPTVASETEATVESFDSGVALVQQPRVK